MYVKYPMVDDNDYRGNVALIVGTASGSDIAYSSVDVLDDDMVVLVEAEIDLVRQKTGVQSWLTTRDDYCRRLDALADEIRESYKYPGQMTIDMEYAQVELVLRDWQAAGSPADEVPDEIQVWQDVTGNDLSWVVNDIENAIVQHRTMISSIRRLRLMGKKDLLAASESELTATFENYAAQLEAIRAVPDY